MHLNLYLTVVMQIYNHLHLSIGGDSDHKWCIFNIHPIIQPLLEMLLAEAKTVCANITEEYSLEDPLPFELLSLTSSIPVKSNKSKRPHPWGVDQRPSDA